MSLLIIKDTFEVIDEGDFGIDESEKRSVISFAFKTGDRELTLKLLEELAQAECDKKCVLKKYNTLIDTRSQLVDSIENLLVALEMYKLETEKSVQRMSDMLRIYGIDVSKERPHETDEEKKRLLM